MALFSSLIRPDPHPERPPLIIYHARCSDGFGAWLAAKRFFSGRAEPLPFEYDVAPPDTTGRDVYILDFSFSPEIMQHILNTARSVVLLDHHASAKTKLAALCKQNACIHFDLTHSGCYLAWKYFFPDEPIPFLYQAVQDRDLWKWTRPSSREFLAYLDFKGYDEQLWESLIPLTPKDPQLNAVLEQGTLLNEAHQKTVRNMASCVRYITLLNHPVAIVNAPYVYHSDIGSLLCEQGALYAAIWCQEANGRIKVGLRALPSSDHHVLTLADSFGGGGHPKSAAFRIEPQYLPLLLDGSLTPEHMKSPIS